MSRGQVFPASDTEPIQSLAPPRPTLTAEALAVAVNQFLRVGATVCRICGIPGDGTIELEHWQTKEKKRIPLEKLLELRPGIDISFLPAPNTSEELIDLLAADDQVRSKVLKLRTDDASFAQLSQVIVKTKWLRALKAQRYHDFRACDLWEPDIAAWAKRYELPLVTAPTLAKWLQEDSKEGNGLLPRYDKRGGKGQMRIDARAQDLLGSIIFESRGPNPPARLRPTLIQTELNTRIARANAAPDVQSQIVVPSLSTVTRVLNASVSPYELAVERFGKTRADRMYEPSSRRPTVSFPSGISEFDDVDSKVFCISRRSGLGWGRPYVTQGVDEASCFPVAGCMDNKPRSEISAVGALVQSIEVKVMTEIAPGAKGLTWEASGFPAGIRFDNALYNSPRIVSLGEDIADASWAQPFQPRQKRNIEYLNGQVILGFFSKEIGYRGALDDHDALAAGLKSAVVYMEDLSDRYFLWLLGVYANRPMADGFTPRQKYLEDGKAKFRSRIPPDTRRLRLLRMVQFAEPLRWGGNGIRTMGLTFQDVDLFRKWVNRGGGSMNIHARIDPFDLRSLYVSVPDSDYVLVVPCLNKDYVEGLTLYQHKLILKMCRQLKLSNPSLADMYKAREELRKMTEQMARSGKIRERRKAERAGDLPGSRATGAAAAEPNATHDVEYGYEQLDAEVLRMDGPEWSMPELDLRMAA